MVRKIIFPNIFRISVFKPLLAPSIFVTFFSCRQTCAIILRTRNLIRESFPDNGPEKCFVLFPVSVVLIIFDCGSFLVDLYSAFSCLLVQRKPWRPRTVGCYNTNTCLIQKRDFLVAGDRKNALASLLKLFVILY